jgi:hypothetical protein
MRLTPTRLVPITASALVLALLAACGGGSSPATTEHATLSGSVAIGAAVTDGKVRALNAAGAVVAHDVPTDANGNYSGIAVSNDGPWRIEACGTAGGSWHCMYAVAQAPGTANVTPLTTAQVALATNQPPANLMNDGASAPSADKLAAAQARLQASLASTLADAGVAANLDFTTAKLTPGAHTGYDRVLDALQVTVGTDGGAFVQITPRLGDGNLYLTPASTQGSIVIPPAAAALPLDGLSTLFAQMNAAFKSADACAPAVTPAAITGGIADSVDADARMEMNGQMLQGKAQVATGLCQYFASGDDGATPMWGSSLVDPMLGGCDFSGPAPICTVGLAMKDPEGVLHPLDDGVAVVLRSGKWLFRGDLYPIQIHANAAVQRSIRVDDPTTSARYSRALQFDLGVHEGVACIQVSQRNADAAPVTIAYFKVNSPAAERMSLWTVDANSNTPSLDPNAGLTRSDDESWIGVADGEAGDALVRNFFRGGTIATVKVYSDAACATPALLDGKSAFDVNVKGMLPVSTALASVPWGQLDDATTGALESLALDAGVAGQLNAAWSFASGDLSFDGAVLCVGGGGCGEGSISLLGEATIRAGAHAVSLPLAAPQQALGAGAFKLLQLEGQDGAGMRIESTFMSCTANPTGQDCYMQ